MRGGLLAELAKGTKLKKAAKGKKGGGGGGGLGNGQYKRRFKKTGSGRPP